MVQRRCLIVITELHPLQLQDFIQPHRDSQNVCVSVCVHNPPSPPPQADSLYALLQANSTWWRKRRVVLFPKHLHTVLSSTLRTVTWQMRQIQTCEDTVGCCYAVDQIKKKGDATANICRVVGEGQEVEVVGICHLCFHVPHAITRLLKADLCCFLYIFNPDETPPSNKENCQETGHKSFSISLKAHSLITYSVNSLKDKCLWHWVRYWRVC